MSREGQIFYSLFAGGVMTNSSVYGEVATASLLTKACSAEEANAIMRYVCDEIGFTVVGTIDQESIHSEIFDEESEKWWEQWDAVFKAEQVHEQSMTEEEQRNVATYFQQVLLMEPADKNSEKTANSADKYKFPSMDRVYVTYDRYEKRRVLGTYDRHESN